MTRSRPTPVSGRRRTPARRAGSSWKVVEGLPDGLLPAVAVPGTDRMFAVGYVDLPTEPRLLRAVIVEYSTANPAPSASTDARV
jgi:hypothetical protein